MACTTADIKIIENIVYKYRPLFAYVEMKTVDSKNRFLLSLFPFHKTDRDVDLLVQHDACYFLIIYNNTFHYYDLSSRTIFMKKLSYFTTLLDRFQI